MEKCGEVPNFGRRAVASHFEVDGRVQGGHMLRSSRLIKQLVTGRFDKSVVLVFQYPSKFFIPISSTLSLCTTADGGHQPRLAGRQLAAMG